MNGLRINNIRELMKEADLDYFVITDPISIEYCLEYTNHPGERLYAFVVGKNNDDYLVMNKLFYLDKELALKIVWYSDTDDGIKVLAANMQDPKRIGIDKNWEAKFLLGLQHCYPKAKYINASPCVDLNRMIKDAKEIKIMKKSSEINDIAVDKAIDLCRKGLSEKEVSSQLKQIYVDLGCSKESFEPIIAYGKNGANPHHLCDDTVPQSGDSIIIDIGGLYEGYCSDMTRTVFFREVSDEARNVYEIVKRANLAAEKIIKPGVKLCDIDAAARNLITEAGYGEYFTHRLGHFIGRDVHEYGDVSSNYDIPVEAGMIFSIEPGIYLPDNFGVRIEDLVLVTADGCEVLNSYTKDLMII